MYEKHFGLRQRPFRAIPDSESYYPATSHELALSQLLQALEDDDGMVLLTGLPGLGKTLLGHCLFDRLGDTVASVFLVNSHFADRLGLLQAILYDLSLPHEGQNEQELRLRLTDFLLKNHEAGRRAIVILDEADHLDLDQLEELRMLSNLESRQGKALQAVLLAQPHILQKLELPELASFAQRLAIRAHLEPLGVHEAADYLVHHVRAAGARVTDVISDEAIEMLARGARGIPRLLNRTVHQALLLAYSAGANIVDAEAALEALNSLGLADSEMGEETEKPIGFAAREETLGPSILEDEPPALAPREESGEEDEPHAGSRSPARPHRLFAPPRRPA